MWCHHDHTLITSNLLIVWLWFLGKVWPHLLDDIAVEHNPRNWSTLMLAYFHVESETKLIIHITKWILLDISLKRGSNFTWFIIILKLSVLLLMMSSKRYNYTTHLCGANDQVQTMTNFEVREVTEILLQLDHSWTILYYVNFDHKFMWFGNYTPHCSSHNSKTPIYSLNSCLHVNSNTTGDFVAVLDVYNVLTCWLWLYNMLTGDFTNCKALLIIEYGSS